jgi:choline-sulfatase
MGRESARHRGTGDGPVLPDRDLHEQGAVRGAGLPPRFAPQQRIGTAATPPNILLLITDQQRYPCYWPEDPGWLRELTPNQHQLEETGLSFDRAFCNTSMCSPSRATLLTGRFPAQHGVTLTHTQADLHPDRRNSPAVARELVGMLRGPRAPRRRALRGFGRGLLRAGPKSGGEPELSPVTPSLAHLLRERGYQVGYKGKWHLTHPSGNGDEGALLGGWVPEDAERLRDDYGFDDWEPPDAGENAKAEHFGAGNAGPLHLGWDEVYTRQVENWLGRADLPEPFCLVVSLVNPHDVLGYPAQHVRGGYQSNGFRDLGVALPPTVNDDLRDKPAVHELMKMGMAAYLGPLRSEEAKLEYVNFYAYLHQRVDEQIGRVLAALGSGEDPDSLRSRTLIFRCADHGEMGLSHGGLRQKAFNTYEETIHIPLVVSNPVLFPKPARTDAFASLVDVLPTVANLAGSRLDDDARGRDLSPVLAAKATPDRERLRLTSVDLNPITGHAAPIESVQDEIHFTYDDHQAATALQNVSGQPNRIRAVRTGRGKFALYFDPSGKRAPEYEMYDLERDPTERRNLVDRNTGETLDAADRALRSELSERLERLMTANETAPKRSAQLGSSGFER